MSHHLPCDNCDKVFGETDKWVTHKRWCKNKSCNLGLAMYRCYDCDKIFCNEGELLRHEVTKTHAKRVRRLKIEASPDFKGYPCECHGKVFETFEKMIRHEIRTKNYRERVDGSYECTMCEKEFDTGLALKLHLTRPIHLERVRWHFHQTVRIWLGSKAETWSGKVLREKKEANRLRQERFRNKSC